MRSRSERQGAQLPVLPVTEAEGVCVASVLFTERAQLTQHRGHGGVSAHRGGAGGMGRHQPSRLQEGN